MPKTMIFKEIAERFDGEWVIVADPKLDPQHHVESGQVIAHGPDRNEVYRQLLGLRPRPKSIASLCFKKLSDDQVIVV